MNKNSNVYFYSTTRQPYYAVRRLHAVTEKLDHESHIDKHLLIIDPTEMSDAAEYTCKVGTQSTTAKLIVDEGRKE